MELYIALNWIATIATTILLAVGVLYRRHNLVKPTIWVYGLYNIAIQWGSSINASTIYDFLPNAWDFFFCANLFPLIGTAISLSTFNKSSKEIYARIANTDVLQYSKMLPPSAVILIASAICMTIYFIWVPPTSTGLIVGITTGDFNQSMMARLDSSMFLSNPIPRYSYAFNSYTLSHLGCIALVLLSIAKRKQHRHMMLLPIIFILFYYILSSTIHGARGPAAFVVLSGFAAYLLANKQKLSATAIIAALLILISIPTAMNMLRSGSELSVYSIFTNIQDAFLRRVFMVMVNVGVYHVDYVQNNGFWGVAGIYRLAMIFHVPHIEPDSVIANTYVGGYKEGIATVGSVFTLYSCFGYVGIIASVFLFHLLDFSLLVVKCLQNIMLATAAAFLATSAINVVGTNYETVLITYGFFPGIFVIAIMNRYFIFVNNRRNAENKSPTSPRHTGQRLT